MYRHVRAIVAPLLLLLLLCLLGLLRCPPLPIPVEQVYCVSSRAGGRDGAAAALGWPGHAIGSVGRERRAKRWSVGAGSSC